MKSYNVMHFKCSINISTFNIPFHGHDEESTSHNRGNFLSIIELLAVYDPLLKAHINNKKGRTKYVSSKYKMS